MFAFHLDGCAYSMRPNGAQWTVYRDAEPVFSDKWSVCDHYLEALTDSKKVPPEHPAVSPHWLKNALR